MITMTCENCGQQLSIPERFSGQKGTCKHCNAPMTVPRLADDDSMPVRADEFAGFNIMHDDHTQPNFVDVSNKPQTTIKKVDRAPRETNWIFLSIMGAILVLGGGVVVVKFVLANLNGPESKPDTPPPPGYASPLTGQDMSTVVTFLDAYRHISWYTVNNNDVYIAWDFPGNPGSENLAMRVAENTANITSQAVNTEVWVYLLDAAAATREWQPGSPGLKFEVGYLQGEVTEKKQYYATNKRPIGRHGRTRMLFRCVLMGIVAGCLGATAHAAPAEIPGYTVAYSNDFEKGLDGLEFTDAKAWKTSGEDGNHVLSLTGKSLYLPKVRSPHNIAWVKDLTVGDFILDVKIQQTGREYGHRDACIFFGRTSPTEFYYVHLATTADEHANSIFLVNNAARVSIAKERTDGTDWSKGFHHVRVKREGERIEVFFDDMDKPVMMTEDKTFLEGGLGLGSFDDTADFEDLAIYAKKK